ncbi:50S ribosome-binding GTPase [Candidatus Poseidonia sp.]|nr:50S ribosome-binding GTPase [Poseidonia sp.]
MAKPPEAPFVVAGSGGVVVGEARTNHEGRRALLLVRGDDDTSELKALVATMGIQIVEVLSQNGRIDPRTYFGKGRLEDIAEERKHATVPHPWAKVDLVIMHTNATPRQLVGVGEILGLELWDRVRLLLALFTAHASSVEARTQVRIAQLQSDRTILRELAARQTTGERAGYGGGGVTALQNVLSNIARELTNLRRRQRKQANAQREHRRQRVRSGALTVGFIGYTNAGKSSLFHYLSGKEVLVEDQLFSTLETTVGRMEDSPRVLLADTIGFIDNIPNATLAAFKATIAEALDADLRVVLVDASDPIEELGRKLETTRREILERQEVEATAFEETTNLMVVLTKLDVLDQPHIKAAQEAVESFGYPTPLGVSSMDGRGMEELKFAIRTHLFERPRTVTITPAQHADDEALERIASDVYDNAMVEGDERDAGQGAMMRAWMTKVAAEKLKSRWKQRIDIK